MIKGNLQQADIGMFITFGRTGAPAGQKCRAAVIGFCLLFRVYRMSSGFLKLYGAKLAFGEVYLFSNWSTKIGLCLSLSVRRMSHERSNRPLFVDMA